MVGVYLAIKQVQVALQVPFAVPKNVIDFRGVGIIAWLNCLTRTLSLASIGSLGTNVSALAGNSDIPWGGQRWVAAP
ncbi:MAG: hypothetical protein U1E12_16360 [Hydrogenophaga sp.]|jgi:hypothetical protein|uniref:hypothetical protein n=1 Tax=unclassified Hydrogenophaga TaxID=2610897 RepID=UPI001484F9B0|nr:MULTISPECIES: hypothetical protein [unclassified Hydrogenophaga]MDP3811710.1 hypothetical protein [Hydrogenophaga sp.]MDZ4103242.1 hypothetical protein [Hydrogenophaga sp.]MDZ4279631.1 hypothetical protein [Hydrogenophaga sp.]